MTDMHEFDRGSASGISIENVWSDDDVVELAVTTSAGSSTFSINVYARHHAVESLIADLDRFKVQVHGGVYDLEFGKFGPEYAAGAYRARLQFYPPGHGRLCITVEAESERYQFAGRMVANRAILHLASEPVLLDNFIAELRQLESNLSNQAKLVCV